MLWARFRGSVSAGCSAPPRKPPTGARPLRPIKITSPAEINMNSAMLSGKISVPNALTAVLEKKPANIPPAMPPPPTIPNTRFASRVVRT